MKNRVLGVTNVFTGAERKFQTWQSLVEWIANEVIHGESRDALLPLCNNWNLDYWDEGETVNEYKARLIDMAIGLQLI